MIYKNSMLIISILFLISSNLAANQKELHVSKVEEIRFSYCQFEIVGNLYLPKEHEKNALAIWVHGDGPDLRTGRFPSTSFLNCFLDNGYAYFRYDKPGFGDSKGSFTDSLLFHERANIVNAAIEILRKHPQVDSSRIGLVGSSQAGYVMPLVLTMRNDIAFMIGLSLPAMDGHEQWAYLLKMQMICEGYTEEKAEEFSTMHLKLIRSPSRQEFLERIKYFEKNPINISSINGYDENFAKAIHDWWPLDWVKTQSFNPMGIIAKIEIPVLAIYGEKDTQVDPQQGAEAYRQSLQAAGNRFYEVRIFPDADHNMAFSKTGCLKEQKERTRSKIVPGLTDFIADWLKKLSQHLDKTSG